MIQYRQRQVVMKAMIWAILALVAGSLLTILIGAIVEASR